MPSLTLLASVAAIAASLKYAIADVSNGAASSSGPELGGVGPNDELPVAPTPAPQAPPRVFEFPPGVSNETVAIGTWSASVARGALAWPHVSDATPPATFSVIQSLASAEEVAAILDVVRDPSLQFDEDEDSVDAMTTHEFYLEADGGFNKLKSINGKPDTDAITFQARKPYRDRLSAITRPIIDNRILPFVNAHVPACGGNSAAGSSSGGARALGSRAVGRAVNGTGCSVCQSLVRRYRDGERLTHATHFDVQALVTVVTALSSYGVDYTGGLFLTTGSAAINGSGELFLALQAGDSAVHQSDLLHGVRVLPPPSPPGEPQRMPERWSWITWIKDGKGSCDDASVSSWAKEGAEAGNAVAQFLQARRSKSTAEKVRWLRASTANGLTRSANELAMHLLQTAGRNASAIAEGEALLALAAERGEPDALYNLGLRAIQKGDIPAAVSLFARSAAAGSSDAAFNMGVAAYTGRGVQKSLDTAAAWFEVAGTARAAYLVASIAEAGTESHSPDAAKAAQWRLKAANGGDGDACMELAEDSLESMKGAQLQIEHADGGEGELGYDAQPSTGDRDAAQARKFKQEAIRWLRCAERAGKDSAERTLRSLTSRG